MCRGCQLEDKITKFRYELKILLNQHSMENASNTAAFILADYLADCLATFDKATTARDRWYGISPKPGAVISKPLVAQELAKKILEKAEKVAYLMLDRHAGKPILAILFSDLFSDLEEILKPYIITEK